MDSETKDPKDLPVTPLTMPGPDGTMVHLGYVRGDGWLALFALPRNENALQGRSHALSLRVGTLDVENRALRQELEDQRRELALLQAVAGTIYPESPPVGYRFYRVDDGWVYTFDGSGWVKDEALNLGGPVIL